MNIYLSLMDSTKNPGRFAFTPAVATALEPTAYGAASSNRYKYSSLGVTIDLEQSHTLHSQP